MIGWTDEEIAKWKDKIEKLDDMMMKYSQGEDTIESDDYPTYRKVRPSSYFVLTQLTEFIYDLVNSIPESTVDIHIHGSTDKRNKLSATIRANNDPGNYELLHEVSHNRGYTVKGLFEYKSYVVCHIAYGKDDINE